MNYYTHFSTFRIPSDLKLIRRNKTDAFKCDTCIILSYFLMFLWKQMRERKWDVLHGEPVWKGKRVEDEGCFTRRTSEEGEACRGCGTCSVRANPSCISSCTTLTSRTDVAARPPWAPTSGRKNLGRLALNRYGKYVGRRTGRVSCTHSLAVLDPLFFLDVTVYVAQSHASLEIIFRSTVVLPNLVEVRIQMQQTWIAHRHVFTHSLQPPHFLQETLPWRHAFKILNRYTCVMEIL